MGLFLHRNASKRFEGLAIFIKTGGFRAQEELADLAGGGVGRRVREGARFLLSREA